jgi:hypothetical protein
LAGVKKSRSEWSLTQEAFDKLLAAFSQDRDESLDQEKILICCNRQLGYLPTPFQLALWRGKEN